ncbi:hypothetical protein DFS28_101329 [Pseudomonas sp. 478]|uniref:hypothetical protein n=1 Tax=unclassified Pseudomonas TaxID=196821 RepID=UPI000DAEB604|nr:MULTISPECIES: hypothetical protein [unclassified Pseudomonas]PZX01979.1 hypothetical protein DFS28_101329 [Pseudomonas sp. 478]TCV52090.1 hypothetical protein EDB99_106127 [Pseudomonas sp. 460]
MNDTRVKIQTSLEVLLKSDTSQLSVTALAIMSGVSRSSLYKYYPDIVTKLKAVQSRGGIPTIELQGLKVSILKKKLEDQKKLVAALARVCSEQLIEISELIAKSRDDNELRDLKIAFLESQLAKTTKPILKTVK